MKIIFLLLAMGFPPCEYEDSNNCYWNAQERGNGQGESFIAWQDEIFYFLT